MLFKAPFKWLRSGAPWIWLTGGAVSFSLLSVLGLLLLIGWKGLAYFWPAPLYQWTDSDNHRIVGLLYNKEEILTSHLPYQKQLAEKYGELDSSVTRYSIKVANRDLFPADFISRFDFELTIPTTPTGWVVIDREEEGQFIGKPIAYYRDNGIEAEDITQALSEGLDQAVALRQEINVLLTTQLQSIGRQLESLRLERRKREFNNRVDADFSVSYDAQKIALEAEFKSIEGELQILKQKLSGQTLLVEDMTGTRTSIAIRDILNVWYPNDMSIFEKVSHWGKQVWVFISEDPRESNSEGGVFPAIFGTMLLVLIMSIMVMPLGVIAAVYLHEYAKDNGVTRMIRVAVINLAGVPSIVYGVFGLGFFVYTIGSSIDAIFYAERAPAPTFGTPGLLWSALTLAVLTLPVVIVATEEGLSRIPSAVRHGSLALGATQFETIWRIVLPMASPAILTGLILAIARAAGEVAPLMLVGVVKLASSLPIDGEFPFVHLERKFMSLGFHIYDIGFQTSNIEAARPLVYATSFLLVMVIVVLNLTAISIRNNLREKYRTMGQD
ncbi:phosphate ABC transporter permease PstA [Vibrio sp. WJH972]